MTESRGIKHSAVEWFCWLREQLRREGDKVRVCVLVGLSKLWRLCAGGGGGGACVQQGGSVAYLITVHPNHDLDRQTWHCAEGDINIYGCLLPFTLLWLWLQRVQEEVSCQRGLGTLCHALTHVAPMGRACSTPVSTTHNGQPYSWVVNLGVWSWWRGATGESLFGSIIYLGRGSLESQQHAMHWPEKHQSRHNVRMLVCKQDGCQVCGVEGFRQGSHYLTVNISNHSVET